MTNRFLASTLAILLGSGVAHAQSATPASAGAPPPSAREDALDPSPVDPANDPDVPMFIGDYRDAPERAAYGGLVFRDMLTQLTSEEPLRPDSRGAVLQYMKAISHASLAPGSTAAGRSPVGDRQVFYTAQGTGTLTVNGQSHPIAEGSGFTLTADFDFTLTNAGQVPLEFYVRWETLPDDYTLSGDVTVVNRFQNDRQVGAHWVHICNGGPNGFNLCTIAPRTMPHPHSHPGEEVWIAVRGETVLTLGKYMARMGPGQAYRIPPTGLTAHSNVNLGDEPVEMLFVGPAQRASTPPNPPRVDFARLDNRPYVRANEPDVDMYMGSWRDEVPRIMHGNLYFRDMLTAFEGTDPLRPTRTGAVLTHATAVSYAQLEPGSTAHPVDGQLDGLQQTFVVDSGTGTITSGAATTNLERGMAFIVPDDVDFRLTATGQDYLNFYVVTERTPAGAPAHSTVAVVDNRTAPQVANSWHDQERPLVSHEQGMVQYHGITEVELPAMAMSRPYSVADGGEEIWIATDGEVDLLIGKELRRLPAGTAYLVPPTGITAHSRVNSSDGAARFLTMRDYATQP
jgi:mannose-6-phosphate isomerase-like protein (cupin superfamily)